MKVTNVGCYTDTHIKPVTGPSPVPHLITYSVLQALVMILLSGTLVLKHSLRNELIGMGFSFFLMTAAQPATETWFLT